MQPSPCKEPADGDKTFLWVVKIAVGVMLAYQFLMFIDSLAMAEIFLPMDWLQTQLRSHVLHCVSRDRIPLRLRQEITQVADGPNLNCYA